jgi:uncharacterized protein (TIGR02646 family)
MIQLRAKPRAPARLRSKEVRNTKTQIRAKVTARKALTDGDFPSYWLRDDIRLTLWEHHRRKCCYCERKREPKREPDIEHFRPKGRVDGEVGTNTGYWWLAYEWSNLFFSCKACNEDFKKDRFPLLRGARARNPRARLANENPVLVDPVSENPQAFIGFDWEFGKVPLAKPIGKDGQGRGAETIRLLGLDREFLNEERGRLLLSLQALAVKMHAAQYLPDGDRLLRETRREIRQATSAGNEFAGFRREFFRKQGLGNYIARD